MLYYVNSELVNQTNLYSEQRNYKYLDEFFRDSQIHNIQRNSIMLVICKDKETFEVELNNYDENGKDLLDIVKVGFIFCYESKSDFDNFGSSKELLKRNYISLFIANSKFYKSAFEWERVRLFEYSAALKVEKSSQRQMVFIPTKVSCINIEDFNLTKNLITYYFEHEEFGVNEAQNLDDVVIGDKCRKFALSKIEGELEKFYKETRVFRYFPINIQPGKIDDIYKFDDNRNDGKIDRSKNKQNLDKFREIYETRLDKFLDFNCSVSDKVSPRELEVLLNEITDGKFGEYFGKARLNIYKKIVECLTTQRIDTSQYLWADVNRPKLESNDVFSYALQLSNLYILCGENDQTKQNSYISYKKDGYAKKIIDDLVNKLDNRYNELRKRIADCKFKSEFRKGLVELFARLFENLTYRNYNEVTVRIAALNDFEKGIDIFNACSSFAETINFIDQNQLHLHGDEYEKFKTKLVEYIKTALESHDFNVSVLCGANTLTIASLQLAVQSKLCLIPHELQNGECHPQNINGNMFGLFNYTEFDYLNTNHEIEKSIFNCL